MKEIDLMNEILCKNSNWSNEEREFFKRTCKRISKYGTNEKDIFNLPRDQIEYLERFINRKWCKEPK